MRWNRGAAILAAGALLASCNGGGYTPASPASAGATASVSKAAASQWPPPCTAPVQKAPGSFYIVNADGTVKPGSFAGAETLKQAYWSHAEISVRSGTQPPPKLGPAIIYWGAYTLTGSSLPPMRGCFVLATSQSGKPLPPPYGGGLNAFTEGVPRVTVPAGSHLEARGEPGGRVKDLTITLHPSTGSGKGEGILLTAGGAVMGRIHITLAGTYRYP
jgi:hypothetical protein